VETGTRTHLKRKATKLESNFRLRKRQSKPTWVVFLPRPWMDDRLYQPGWGSFNLLSQNAQKKKKIKGPSRKYFFTDLGMIIDMLGWGLFFLTRKNQGHTISGVSQEC
jgi:hypothetical protein